MNRTEILLQGIDRRMAGMEIAPWFAPIASKGDGHNVRILDVFDRETLKKIGRADPQQNWRDMDTLEEVDFVGSATEIADLVPDAIHGTFDYIVSSHNFEHLPNPIKFLSGCGKILKLGGILSMAVPDRRTTFDRFRVYTPLAEWVEAFLEDRSKPSLRQLFDNRATTALLHFEGADHYAHSLGHPLESWRCIGNVALSFQFWKDNLGQEGRDYADCHCTVMTPASLELLLMEARQLNLINLEIESISETVGCEFFVRLRNPVIPTVVSADEFSNRRNALMRSIIEENCDHQTIPPKAELPIALRPLKRLARNVRGVGRRLRGKPE